MKIQLNLTGTAGPRVLFYNSIDDALRAAWTFSHETEQIRPVSIVESGRVVYTQSEIEAVTALYASVQDWPA